MILMTSAQKKREERNKKMREEYALLTANPLSSKTEAKKKLAKKYNLSSIVTVHQIVNSKN